MIASVNISTTQPNDDVSQFPHQVVALTVVRLLRERLVEFSPIALDDQFPLQYEVGTIGADLDLSFDVDFRPALKHAAEEDLLDRTFALTVRSMSHETAK